MLPDYLLRALTDTAIESPAEHALHEIHVETVSVPMRDGTRLATDLYLPPRLPAPVIAMRTPYGRANQKVTDALMAFARRGHVVLAQDCRGTGDSEPDHWDYYIYEPEDSFDCIEWITRQQWFGGFIGTLGSSYVAQTQWCMALHPSASTIVPEVSGLGVLPRTARKYMFYTAYARSVGKGANKVSMTYEELERHVLQETLSGGYFNEPLEQPIPTSVLARYPQVRTMTLLQAQQYLWEKYCSMTCMEREHFIKDALGVEEITLLQIEALTAIFGHRVPHDAFTVPHPRRSEIPPSIHAPALMITGWYDWSLNDALATWDVLVRTAPEPMRSTSRLVITPSAHNTPGYHEGEERHPELQQNHRVTSHVDLLLHWYRAVREQRTDSWPKVTYYLMGANEWRTASAWPPPEAREIELYLTAAGELVWESPPGLDAVPSTYVYDPEDPTPTVGGSIVSCVYPPGSVDVAEVQKRRDVLTFTTAPLESDIDVVGPLRLILYASSTARDTDFSARVTDVFPDGRALQLQSGILRTRYRNPEGAPELLVSREIYRFEIDLWATANRFRAGHRLRLDISSADFPRFDRNTNRAGEPGAPVSAIQTIYHDAECPSHLRVHTIGSAVHARS